MSESAHLIQSASVIDPAQVPLYMAIGLVKLQQLAEAVAGQRPGLMNLVQGPDFQKLFQEFGFLGAEELYFELHMGSNTAHLEIGYLDNPIVLIRVDMQNGAIGNIAFEQRDLEEVFNKLKAEGNYPPSR